jgi:hypothetical protein
LNIPGAANLRHHHDRADLLHLRGVCGGGAIEVAGDLYPKIRDGNELLEDVLRHDVGEIIIRLVNVFAGYVNVVLPSAKIGGGNCTSSPFSLGRKGLLFILRSRRNDYLFTPDILRLGRDCGKLSLFLLLFLYLRSLLSLHLRRRYLHSQNDISNFATCQ